jgi:type IV pilus biogenesis/stability protein PilW
LVNTYINTLLALALAFVLSACVTQNFENGETPVVQNQSNRDDMAATRISLGLGYLKMGNMPQAKQNLEKAKKFAPDMVQVYTAFAHYYETVGEHELTIDSYETALSIKSEDADTLNNYGVYLCRQDQVEEAEKQFLKAIAVPTYLLVSKSYENLASCFLQKDDFDKAESYLKKAILHSPSNASILFQMVRLQYAMGEYEQAKYFEQRFEKVTRRFTPQSLALAYKVYLKLNQRRTAKNYGAMLVKMYPQSWEAQQYLLNELELIDADNLAKRYQLTQVKKQDKKSKKRVVKLSPKKSSATNVASKPKEKTAIPATVNTSTKPTKTLLNTVSTGSTAVMASSQSINSALTGTTPSNNAAEKVELQTSPSQQAIEQKPSLNVNTDSEKNAVILASGTKVSTDTDSNAQVVVDESSNSIVKNQSINEESLKSQAENVVLSSQVAVNKTQNTDVSSQSLEQKPQEVSSTSGTESSIALTQAPVEDEDILAVAKKPEPIIEETVETTEILTKKEPAIHTVEKGDTLFGISVKYNVKIKAIRQWNNLSSKQKIRIKDKLFVENPNVVNQVNE